MSIQYRLNIVDLNECENPDNCLYGECVNKPGGYECRCPPNFELNPAGTGCVGKDGYAKLLASFHFNLGRLSLNI